MIVFVGWIIFRFLRQMHSPKQYVAFGSIALVFVVVIAALMAVTGHICPRSQRIVYLTDNDCSKTKQSPSTQETVPLIVDKFVSKHYRVDQQRYTALLLPIIITIITIISTIINI